MLTVSSSAFATPAAEGRDICAPGVDVMIVTEAIRRRLIEAVARRVIDHADELTALDQAIGDGDHGINMRRGCEAVLADLDGLAAKPLPEALKAIGMALVMKVGGASGPLYGTLFMTLGKALPAEPSPSDLVAALDQAIAAVKARGKSDVGQKTMLDVLAPARDALAGGRELRDAADRAANATIPMRAIRGRASFLGDRSIGHMDPGARSSALMIGAIAEIVERAL
jgi:dihydroxyacetone kinase-like protein